MSDVRISCHIAKSQPSGNREFVIIRFYEGLQNLIGTDYVILSVKNNRLYFTPTQTKVKGSLKLTEVINVWKQASKIKCFEGEYTLAYDITKELYYVDKDSKTDLTRVYGNHNVPHPNYIPHVNAPYENETPVENIVDAKYSVYDALITLLSNQIKEKEYKSAMFTAQTIQSLLERE